MPAERLIEQGERRGAIYTRAESRLVTRIGDPEIVKQVHAFKREFNTRMGAAILPAPGSNRGPSPSRPGRRYQLLGLDQSCKHLVDMRGGNWRDVTIRRGAPHP